MLTLVHRASRALIWARQTCGSVDVGERDRLVLLRLESRFHIGGSYGRTEWRLDGVHVGAIRTQADGE